MYTLYYSISIQRFIKPVKVWLYNNTVFEKEYMSWTGGWDDDGQARFIGRYVEAG